MENQEQQELNSQEAIIFLQHAINHLVGRPASPDAIYRLAFAISDIVREAVLNGDVAIDPLLGADDLPREPLPPITGPHFDYTHQAWTVDGRYIRCGHKAESCDCYGTVHAGEIADLNDLPTAQESDADRIHRENLERGSSPAYQRREREVSSAERSIRRSN